MFKPIVLLGLGVAGVAVLASLSRSQDHAAPGQTARTFAFDRADALKDWTITGDVTIDAARGRLIAAATELLLPDGEKSVLFGGMIDPLSSPVPACPQCAQLVELEALVRDLQERLNRNSSNSLIPPFGQSAGRPQASGQDPERAQTGGQSGHPGHHRQPPSTRAG